MSENKYCGNCYYFSNEDIGGEGLCGYPLSPFVTLCGKKGCKHHTFRKPANNGWIEITPDKIEYIKEHERRIIIGNSHHGSTFYRTIHDVNGIDSMAKMGGYYYYVLPELKIKEESK